MTLVKPRPTSPGRRSMVKVVSPELHKGKPYEPLLESQKKHSGRNNNDRITEINYSFQSISYMPII